MLRHEKPEMRLEKDINREKAREDNRGRRDVWCTVKDLNIKVRKDRKKADSKRGE